MPISTQPPMRLWFIIILLFATTLSIASNRLSPGADADTQEAPCDSGDDTDDFDDDWAPEPHLALITIESRVAAREATLALRHVPAPVIDRPPCPFAG